MMSCENKEIMWSQKKYMSRRRYSLSRKWRFNLFVQLPCRWWRGLQQNGPHGRRDGERWIQTGRRLRCLESNDCRVCMPGLRFGKPVQELHQKVCHRRQPVYAVVWVLIVGVKDAIIECTAMLQRHFMQFAKNVMPRKRCVMRAKCNPSPGQMAMRHFCRAAENIVTTKIVWRFRVRQVQGLSTRHWLSLQQKQVNPWKLCVGHSHGKSKSKAADSDCRKSVWRPWIAESAGPRWKNCRGKI